MKKTMSRIILAGLLIGSLSIPLPVRAAQSPQRLSKQEIDQKIAAIKKTVKQMRRLKYITTVLIAGAAPAVFVASVATIGGAFFFILKVLPEKMGSGKISDIAGHIAHAAMITAVVSGIASIVISLPAGIGTYIGLSAATTIIAYKAAKKLETIEKNTPGTLTKEQKTVITQFKKLWRGPIVRAAVKGLRIKTALTAATQSVLRRSPRLLAQLGGANKANKTIKEYISLNWQKRNLQAALDIYEARKEELTAARDKHQKKTRPYRKAKRKLILFKLKPKYLLLKLQNRKIKKKIEELQNRYGKRLEQKSIVNATQQFMQKADTIVQELQKPV